MVPWPQGWAGFDSEFKIQDDLANFGVTRDLVPCRPAVNVPVSVSDSDSSRDPGR